MARRKSEWKAPPPVIETYRIQAKYAPDIFFPSNAVEEGFWKRNIPRTDNVRFLTLDDKVCIPKFISTTNNRDGWADERFDDFCKRKFDIPFCNLRSMWISRLGNIDYYWHWVQLTIVE